MVLDLNAQPRRSTRRSTNSTTVVSGDENTAPSFHAQMAAVTQAKNNVLSNAHMIQAQSTLTSTLLGTKRSVLGDISSNNFQETVVAKKRPLIQTTQPNVLPTADVNTYSQPWINLDLEDMDDPLMVAQYVNEIMQYMHSLEPAILPDPNYMANQKELTWRMRTILVDWLIEVQWKLKLLPETLFLSINIIDRFLSRRACSLIKLQLVGLSATLLASKYEEVLSPSIANFIYLSDNTYDDAELLRAERYMLQVLNFSLAYPNPLVYLRRISKADNYDVHTRTMAKFLMEYTLLEEAFLPCTPSLMAAFCVYLARRMYNSGPWNANLVHYSGDYAEDQLKPWSDLLISKLCMETSYEALFRKYSQKKFLKVALVARAWICKNFPTSPIGIKYGEEMMKVQQEQPN